MFIWTVLPVAAFQLYRKQIDEWARREGLRVLSCKLVLFWLKERRIWRTHFLGRTDGIPYGALYEVSVETRDHLVRYAWLGVGSFILGPLTKRVLVAWEE